MKRFKPKTRFGQAMALIVFAVVFSAFFNNIEPLWDLVKKLVALLNPLWVGMALAFFLNVPMRGIENIFAKVQTKWKKPVTERRNSIISLIITYLLAPAVIILVFYAIIPQVIKAIPSIVASIEAAWPRLLNFLHRFNIDTQEFEGFLKEIDLNSVVTTITNNIETIVETSVSAVSSVVSVVVLAITGFVISIYILANKKKLSRQVKKLLYAYTPRRFADRTVEVAVLTNKTFTDFLAGQCLEALILGTMFFVVLSILKMPFALVISVFLTLTALIPYVGAILGFLVGALLILTVSPFKALIYIIVSVVIQQVENQFIYPKVVGTSVGLSPMWILISVFVGGNLFGLLGTMFFIPFVAVAYSLLRVNMNNRLKDKKLKVDDNGIHSEEAGETEPPEDEPTAP
ncbi:MAG: AI-2E family transporter [Ruminococcaceae bacterium]|nr:AI-2E family transporter [Oscillospiraceae bacterium]